MSQQLPTRPNDQSIIIGDAHTVVDYPKLNLDVFIVGNCFRSGAVAMFAKAGCRGAMSIEDADLVCFLGGEDIDPSLYGEPVHDQTYFNSERDKREVDIYAQALSLGIPMFGICRGMQLLNVLAGGRLYQHVDNHGIYGGHMIRDIRSDELYYASSMHHQMCIEFDGCIPVAYSEENRSGTYHSMKDGVSTVLTDFNQKELEAAYYPSINAFGVQGHPEVPGYDAFTKWSLECVLDLVHDVEQKEIITAKVHQGS